jgi:hypothetical protein
MGAFANVAFSLPTARAAQRAGVVLTVCIALGACGSEAPPAASANQVAGTERMRAIAQIDAARAERGLPPINVVADAGPLAAAEREIQKGASPDQAIRVALQRVVESETSEASGWCLPTHDVTRIELPSVVLEQRDVYVSVAAIKKPLGAEPPFVVCLLVFEDGPEVPSTDG